MPRLNLRRLLRPDTRRGDVKLSVEEILSEKPPWERLFDRPLTWDAILEDTRAGRAARRLLDAGMGERSLRSFITLAPLISCEDLFGNPAHRPALSRFLCGFMTVIKSMTGRYYDREVADLLTAAWDALYAAGLIPDLVIFSEGWLYQLRRSARGRQSEFERFVIRLEAKKRGGYEQLCKRLEEEPRRLSPKPS